LPNDSTRLNSALAPSTNARSRSGGRENLELDEDLTSEMEVLGNLGDGFANSLSL
jgi:hypothetical protein